MQAQKIGLAACAALSVLAVTHPPANAAFIFMVEQSGANVVVTGSGSIDTAALSFSFESGTQSGIASQLAIVRGGPAAPTLTPANFFTGASGPTSLGSAGADAASSGSGDLVGVSGFAGEIALPTTYVSGAALSDSATFNNVTLSALGLTPGNYVYMWGTGPTADSLTVEVGTTATPAPEPASIAMLCLPAALLPWRRNRRSRG
jgi:hypothetical protein